MRKRQKFTDSKKFIPSIFTLANILCGFLAILTIIEGNDSRYIVAAWLIIVAAIFDAFDGKLARLTSTSSRFGVELDSLADVVSFGFAPAVLIYTYILSQAGWIGLCISFGFLACGAIRLARFNTTATTGPKGFFVGMPTPAAAGLLASFILFNERVWHSPAAIVIAVAATILTSFAMVSTFRYDVMPKVGFSRKKDLFVNIFTFILLVLIIFPSQGLFPAGIIYLLSGPFKSIIHPAVKYHAPETR